LEVDSGRETNAGLAFVPWLGRNGIESEVIGEHAGLTVVG
jgi:hypothetical protein